MENNRQELGLIVLLALMAVCVVGQLYLPLPLLGALAAQYAAMDFSPSWLVAGFGYAYAVGFLVFGPLSDGLGRRRVMLGCLVLLMLATLAVAYAPSGHWLLAARVGQGFIAASFPPVVLAYVNEKVSPPRRGLAVACLAFAFLAAVALAQALVIGLGAVDLRLPEQVLLAVYAVLGVCLLRRLAPDAAVKSVNLLALWRQLPRLLVSPSLWRLYLLAAALLLALIGFYSAFAPVLAQGFSPLALRLWTLPFLAACFLAAPLMRHLGQQKAVLLALSLGIAALLGALAADGWQGVFVALCALSSAVALLVPMLIARVAQSAPDAQRGSAVALYTFVMFCGASAAPLLFLGLSPNIASAVLAAVWGVGLFLSLLKGENA